ncbi:MAG: bifunctional diaminohydroxyphosphoribosylaminopyrimidine deaminase/5-amino-6-(5-phosphoribosylamino)uracil reductase RibD [Nitratireductor sp.]|nr:bifunctional diaminohydroxyphosphoribosylaminopyrimidine deaminase/5-amino-6-(5-phosphoribosylamino)uracil reductase RibD [Nitratireductor sp.]
MIKPDDTRFMAAAIRLARRNEGLTATNPSVACLIVRDDGNGPFIVGTGVTARGGRPHAEPIALEEAGERARGATAYVTLEPCAHHGRTPPCAQTLIDAGIARVVSATPDPDIRVDGKGHAMLRAAGIAVDAGCMAGEAASGLFAYLTHKQSGRPGVTLKLAVSRDAMLGRKGEGQVAITGAIARAQTHLMRARHHAILVGVGTVIEDDPELTCRLPGLQARSPLRIVLDPNGRMPARAKLAETARQVRTLVVAPPGLPVHAELVAKGCEILACETVNDRVALPELMEDLGARGIQSLMVEGGASVAASFLAEDLVDRIALFQGPETMGGQGIASPLAPHETPAGFALTQEWRFGDDRLREFARE